MKESTLEIYPHQINRLNWEIGNILEDVRKESPTFLHQFEIVDHLPPGVIVCRLLDREEWLKPEFLAGRII